MKKFLSYEEFVAECKGRKLKCLYRDVTDYNGIQYSGCLYALSKGMKFEGSYSSVLGGKFDVFKNNWSPARRKFEKVDF